MPNAFNVIGKWSLPWIDETLDPLGRVKAFSRFGLLSVFYGDTIYPNSVAMAALITPRGVFRFVRMTQGHADVPSAFVRSMRLVFAGLDSTYMYLDDGTVFNVIPDFQVE